jgi:hypothetical protein
MKAPTAFETQGSGKAIKTADNSDFSVVVKDRAPLPKPWRWEIYRAGVSRPIEHSAMSFVSMTEAARAGKAALKLMLSEHPQVPQKN